MQWHFHLLLPHPSHFTNTAFPLHCPNTCPIYIWPRLWTAYCCCVLPASSLPFRPLPSSPACMYNARRLFQAGPRTSRPPRVPAANSRPHYCRRGSSLLPICLSVSPDMLQAPHHRSDNKLAPCTVSKTSQAVPHRNETPCVPPSFGRQIVGGLTYSGAFLRLVVQV